MIRLHVISYSLFIASLLMYLGSYLIPRKGLISLMTIVISITNTLSQAILGFIFLYISNGNKSSPSKPKRINYSKESLENLSKEEDSSSEEEYDPVQVGGSSRLVYRPTISMKLSLADD